MLKEQLFPYFLHELFMRTDPGAQAMLMRTAVLSAFTARQAASLAGDADAATTIDALCAQHFFIERSDTAPPAEAPRAATAPTYRYHALFRSFLLQQLEARLSADERAALHKRAAELLLESEPGAPGAPEEALALLTQAGEGAAAGRVLRGLAPALLGQGRHATLERLLDTLGPATEADPWLHYWRGMARMPIAPRHAREAMAAAHAGFERRGDRVACAQAASGVLEATLHEWNELHHVDRWGEILRALLADGGLPAEVESRALASVSVLMMRGPGFDDLVGRAVRRALALIPAIEAPAPRLAAGCLASLLLSFTGDWLAGRQLVREVDAWLDPASVPQLQLLMWHWLAARHLLWGGEPAAAAERFESLLRLKAEHDLRAMEVVTEGLGAFLAINADQVGRAEAHVERMRAALRPARRLDAANAEMQAGIVAMARGRAAEACALLRAAGARTEACGSQMLTAQTRLMLASAQTLAGDLAGAATSAAGVVDYGRRAAHAQVEHAARLVLAWATLRDGKREVAIAGLRTALELGRRHDFALPFPWVPRELLQELCALALERGIEPALVHRMIRVRDLPAPPRAPRHWPWPVRLRCLGGFDVLVDGAPPAIGAKAPKKPLELLRALVALGGPDGAVPLARIEHALWPDLEGDAARNACHVALHRLRRLLGDERTIAVREARLALDRERVWADVWAFDELAERLAERPVQAAQRELLELYRGAFLAGDDAAWAQAPRQRLRGRFLRTGAALAEALDRAGEHEAASALRERIADADRADAGPNA